MGGNPKCGESLENGHNDHEFWRDHTHRDTGRTLDKE